MRPTRWILCLLCFSCWLTAGEPSELSWCLDDHWHDSDASSNQQAPSFRLMQTLAERLGVAIVPSEVTPFSRCLYNMRQGDSDLMVSLNFSEERHQYMHLIPYDTANPEIIFVRNHEEEPHQWQDLVSKQLAVLSNYSYSSEIQHKLQQHNMLLIEVTTLEDAFALLLLHDADAVLAPAQSASNVIRNNPRFHQQFKAANYQVEITDPRYIHLAFSRQSRHQELLPMLQQILQQMMESGEVAQYRQHSNSH